MIKHSISRRLFCTMTIILCIFLCLPLIAQYTLFENFYVSNDIKHMNKHMNDLRMILEDENRVDEYDEAIAIFSEKNSTEVAVVSWLGTKKHVSEGSSVMATMNVGEYRINIDSFIVFQDFTDLIQNGKQVTIEGYKIGDEQSNRLNYDIYPTTIIVDDTKFELATDENLISKESIYNWLAPKIVEVEDVTYEGTVSNLKTQEDIDYSAGYRNTLLNKEITEYIRAPRELEEQFSLYEMEYYIKEDTNTGNKNIFYIQPIMYQGSEPTYIIGISSLQAVEGLVDITHRYLRATILITMVGIIIPAYYYAKYITRPLIKINNVTKDMAKLDFSNECDVETHDEVGELAQNINTLSHELEGALSELTEANKQLKKDIELKDRVDQFRKSFIADVSHELKTPLTVMRGVCQGVSDGLYDKEELEIALKEIDGMNALVYDLLESAKIDSEGIEYQEEIFQLDEIILKQYARVKQLAKEKNIKVSFDMDDIFVKGEEKNIETVIKNFLVNSIRYTQEGGEVRIKIASKDGKGYCEIENSSAHIPEDSLENIWEPFYVVDKSRNKKLGGSGLGLYIVRQILEKHGSDFGVENTEFGVKAYFTLEQIKEEDTW